MEYTQGDGSQPVAAQYIGAVSRLGRSGRRADLESAAHRPGPSASSGFARRRPACQDDGGSREEGKRDARGSQRAGVRMNGAKIKYKTRELGMGARRGRKGGAMAESRGGSLRALCRRRAAEKLLLEAFELA